MENRQDRDAEEAATNKIKGTVNQVKGNVKEAWGDLIDNPAREHEGARDRVKGQVQEESGEIKEKESRIEHELDEIDRKTI